MVLIRFLLLNPPADGLYVKEGRCQHKAAVFSSVYPPMTLAYMASLLRDSSEVLLLDAVGGGLSTEEVRDRVSAFKPDFIVCNITTPTFSNDVRVLESIRDAHASRVFVFGVHATVLCDDVIKHQCIDGVIVGEPELTVRDLSVKPVEEVEGIVYKHEGRVVRNPARGFMDLKSLPVPAWDMVDLSNYRIPVFGRKYVLVTTGRGCPYGCVFCVSKPYYGVRYRKRSVADIINEVMYAVGLGVKDFFFFSETFTLDKDHVISLCDALISGGLDVRWVCNSRVDTVDEEMLSKMKSAGCWMISFGIESASQSILDSAGKGIRVDDSRLAVRMAHDAGLVVVGHFIFGLPGETVGSIEDTIRFSIELPLDFAEYYSAVPFPGSRLYDESLGVIDGVDWGSFEYSSSVFSRDIDLEHYRSSAYRRFYLRFRTFYGMLRIFGVSKLPLLIKTGFEFMSTV
ncbi:MAG: radical SAM protein [Candidatus Altiarchaeota archaeon]